MPPTNVLDNVEMPPRMDEASAARSHPRRERIAAVVNNETVRQTTSRKYVAAGETFPNTPSARYKYPACSRSFWSSITTAPGGEYQSSVSARRTEILQTWPTERMPIGIEVKT